MRPLLAAALFLLGAAPPTRTLSVLEGFQRHVSDEHEPASARTERLTSLATAIDGATTNRDERALLITKAWHESRFASYVQFDHDRCRLGEGGRCDGGKAFGVLQLHGTKRDLTLSEQMTRALRQLRFGIRRCKMWGASDPVRGAIALYATGNSCDWAGSDERVATWRKIRGRL